MAAPTLLHKMEVQVRLFREFCRVVPVTSACFEMGKFDTQALKAVSKGEPVPEGEGYQKGERYGTDTSGLPYSCGTDIPAVSAGVP